MDEKNALAAVWRVDYREYLMKTLRMGIEGGPYGHEVAAVWPCM